MMSTAHPGKAKRGPWQAYVVDNLEWIIQAVILAVVIRCFVLEAFVIPTGSMAPTLYGKHVSITCPNCTLQYDVGVDRATGRPYSGVRCPNCLFNPRQTRGLSGGDKIMVNKLYYQFFPIQRWDIVVFKSPEAIEKNLIKRVIGLPGEEVTIAGGDILINGRIVRKPPAVQRKLWMLVHDSRLLPGDNSRFWALEDGWQRTDGGLAVNFPEDRQTPTFADYLPEVTDFYAYYPNSGKHVVEDLKLTLQVTPRSGNGALILELSSRDRSFRCRLPTDASSPITLEDDGREVARADNTSCLRDGAPTRLEFASADCLVSLRMGGREVLTYDCWPGPDNLRSSTGQSSIRIGSQGLSLLVEPIAIFRDIYYLPASDGRSTFQVAQDSYFVLGDSCPNSGDSRRLGPVPRKDMLGKALLVWWPLSRIRLVR